MKRRVHDFDLNDACFEEVEVNFINYNNLEQTIAKLLCHVGPEYQRQACTQDTARSVP